METKDLIIYGALIYLFFMLKKKQTCNCQSSNLVLDNNKNLVNNLNCNSCGINQNVKSFESYPSFTKVNNQIEPTPATILNPNQLMSYNSKGIKGVNNQYTC